MSKNIAKALKITYNKKLEIWKRSEKFFNNPEISDEEKEKWKGEANKIVDRLDSILNELKSNGINYNTHNILYGFII